MPFFYTHANELAPFDLRARKPLPDAELKSGGTSGTAASMCWPLLLVGRAGSVKS